MTGIATIWAQIHIDRIFSSKVERNIFMRGRQRERGKNEEKMAGIPSKGISVYGKTGRKPNEVKLKRWIVFLCKVNHFL